MLTLNMFHSYSQFQPIDWAIDQGSSFSLAENRVLFIFSSLINPKWRYCLIAALFQYMYILTFLLK